MAQRKAQRRATHLPKLSRVPNFKTFIGGNVMEKYQLLLICFLASGFTAILQIVIELPNLIREWRYGCFDILDIVPITIIVIYVAAIVGLTLT